MPCLKLIVVIVENEGIDGVSSAFARGLSLIPRSRSRQHILLFMILISWQDKINCKEFLMWAHWGMK